MCGSLSLTHSLFGGVCVCVSVFWLWKLLRLLRGRANCAGTTTPSSLAQSHIVSQSEFVPVAVIVIVPIFVASHLQRTGSRNTRKSWWHPRLILFILLFFQFDFVTFLLNACICQSSISWLAKIAFLYFPPFHFDSRTTLINSSNILLRFVSLTFRFGHGYGTE